MKLLVLLVVILLSCVSCLSSSGAGPNKPHYTIWVDNTFKSNEKLDIEAALIDLEEKTNGVYEYELRFGDKSYFGLEEVANTVYVYAEDPGGGLVGWTSWDVGRNGAYMKIIDGMDDALFRTVMLHELFHSAHIVHYFGSYKSIMRPSVIEGWDVQCEDMVRFCAEWNCKTDCELVEDGAYAEGLEVVEGLHSCGLTKKQ